MRYMDMTPEDLRRAYWDTRALAASWDKMARPDMSRRGRAKVAGGVLRNLRQLDLIVNVARKRGISLSREATS